MVVEKNLIEIKEMKVEKLRMGQKALDLSFLFSLQGKSSRIKKTFNFSDNTVNFILSVIKDIKKINNAEIEKEQEMQEKLVNYLRRLLQQVKDLEKYKDYSRYMKEFNRIDCYKVTFPEIEINPKKYSEKICF